MRYGPRRQPTHVGAADLDGTETADDVRWLIDAVRADPSHPFNNAGVPGNETAHLGLLKLYERQQELIDSERLDRASRAATRNEPHLPELGTQDQVTASISGRQGQYLNPRRTQAPIPANTGLRREPPEGWERFLIREHAKQDYYNAKIRLGVRVPPRRGTYEMTDAARSRGLGIPRQLKPNQMLKAYGLSPEGFVIDEDGRLMFKTRPIENGESSFGQAQGAVSSSDLPLPAGPTTSLPGSRSAIDAAREVSAPLEPIFPSEIPAPVKIRRKGR